MSEENKPKIDLKARLGKKNLSSPAASALSAPSAASAPLGVPSVVSAPFAPTPAQAQAEPVMARPAAIRVEMDDEVLAVQKRGRGKVLVGAAVGVALGIALGFGGGSMLTARQGQEAAKQGAKSLAVTVKTATAEAVKLDAVIDEILKAVSEQKDPSELASKLGALNVGFTGGELEGKGLGRFNAQTTTALFQLVSQADTANAMKERLQALLSGPQMKRILELRDNPQASAAVVVDASPGGPLAKLVRLAKPFPLTGDETWPASLKFAVGQQMAEGPRYTKGAPDRSIVPLDPSTEAALCGDPAMALQASITALRGVLKGGASGGGLIDNGTKLTAELTKIGG